MSSLHGDIPAYISDGLMYFNLINGGPRWSQLVKAWVEYERKLGFPTNSQERPKEIKMWSRASRSYEKLPKVKSTKQYAVGWKRWWTSLQPSSRLENSNAWPPARREPARDEDWAAIRRGGPNGMFLAVVSLAWWLWAAIDAGEEVVGSDVEQAMDDVLWVCETCTIRLSDTRKRVTGPEDHPDAEGVAQRPKRACRRT
ncbi:hypothetical protein BD311DRAFT_677921 [Dichomitus squalens]|uniref:Uncharacterized protein n=1 Tax=Dichomitus squalens TaxID=114155 RepID=A0A4Q9M713_9APHY|nr:hypothetical protein BD311DRAFT_677921 [Dichomitus squalens]